MGIISNAATAAEKARKDIGKGILELTGIDVTNLPYNSSSRNFVFIQATGTKPCVIRVGRSKTKEQIQSELLFMDYLREHVHTICQPVPFNNKLLNVMHTEHGDYDVTVFRKANGAQPSNADYCDEYYELFGKKIGEIHAASKEATVEGFKYKRIQWYERESSNFEMLYDRKILGRETIDAIIAVREKIKNLSATPDNYGMIHGDFHELNTFLDWDDIWVYDFDDCCYGFFAMDIAGFLSSVYRRCVSCGSFDDLKSAIECFKKGYGRSYKLQDEFFEPEMLETFLKFRISSTLVILASGDSFFENINQYIKILASTVEAIFDEKPFLGY